MCHCRLGLRGSASHQAGEIARGFHLIEVVHHMDNRVDPLEQLACHDAPSCEESGSGLLRGVSGLHLPTGQINARELSQEAIQSY